MNTGAFGEGFPYTNFHDLNMDWIIKIAKDFLDQYTHIQEIIEQGKTDIQDLTTSGLEQLQEKADNLEELLQAWYNEHSEDIANELADALSDLNDWYTEHSTDISTALTTAINTFTETANERAQDAIESIPADYTDLYNQVQYLDYAKEGIFADKAKLPFSFDFDRSMNVEFEWGGISNTGNNGSDGNPIYARSKDFFTLNSPHFVVTVKTDNINVHTLRARLFKYALDGTFDSIYYSTDYQFDANGRFEFYIPVYEDWTDYKYRIQIWDRENTNPMPANTIINMYYTYDGNMEKYGFKDAYPIAFYRAGLTPSNGNEQTIADDSALTSVFYKFDTDFIAFLFTGSISNNRFRVFKYNTDRTFVGVIYESGYWDDVTYAELVIDPAYLYRIIAFTRDGSVLPTGEVFVFNAYNKFNPYNKIPYIESGIFTIAHQGGKHAGTPQNTVANLMLLVKDGIKKVDMDVVFSSDNIPYISHDPVLTTTNSDTVDIRTLTASQINELTFVINGQNVKLNTLTEMLSVCKQYGLYPCIEFKNNPSYTNIINAVNLTKEYGVYENSMFGSFALGELKDIFTTYFHDSKVFLNINQTLPSISDIESSDSYANMRTLRDGVKEFYLSIAKSLNPSKDYLLGLRGINIKSIIWTCDTLAEVKGWIGRLPDGITSNTLNVNNVLTFKV